ncbi:MAG: DUF2264 domain-containing protein [Lachnospiraceae bacterium]|nr:DUF2264 domain-containing protein [Lachnospiraceae bacterium]
MKGKAYFQNMLLELMEPLKSHYSPEYAYLKLGAASAGYGNRIAGMEGFSRILWGMASYWAGGGEDESLLSVYQKGLQAGTNPESGEYWGNLHNKDQRMVEMAAISYGILMVPEKLWEPLGEEGQQHLADWLYQINLYTQADNNWQYFKVLVNLALKSVGKKWNPEQVKDAMERYESFYLGNGWYSDGKRPQKDYYVSFGIHFYCLLYAKFMEKEDPENSIRFKKRACEFAKTFLYWFDEEGKALPFGRSLTYRFAEAAFFSACALAGVECFSWGVMKGIIERHLEYWMEQPIFDNAGVLTVGYTYPNLMMSETYNAPGSPYWALKTFVFLALPDDHPFWRAESEALPGLQPVRAVKECDMLLCHRENEVTALTAGQYPTMEHPYAAEKYAKFAYSSRFGFCVSRSYHHLEQAGTDNMLIFYVHGMYYVRRACHEFSVTDEQVYSRWSPVEGIEVETWLWPTENGHRRRHRITSSLECTAYDCGFSYPNCMEETEKLEQECSAEGRKIAAVWDRNGKSQITSVFGQGKVITAFSNMNIIFPNVCIPAIQVEIHPGVSELETLVETEFVKKKIRIGEGNCYAVCE